MRKQASIKKAPPGHVSAALRNQKALGSVSETLERGSSLEEHPAASSQTSRWSTEAVQARSGSSDICTDFESRSMEHAGAGKRRQTSRRGSQTAVEGNRLRGKAEASSIVNDMPLTAPVRRAGRASQVKTRQPVQLESHGSGGEAMMLRTAPETSGVRFRGALKRASLEDEGIRLTIQTTPSPSEQPSRRGPSPASRASRRAARHYSGSLKKENRPRGEGTQARPCVEAAARVQPALAEVSTSEVPPDRGPLKRLPGTASGSNISSGHSTSPSVHFAPEPTPDSVEYEDSSAYSRPGTVRDSQSGSTSPIIPLRPVHIQWSQK